MRFGTKAAVFATVVALVALVAPRGEAPARVFPWMEPWLTIAGVATLWLVAFSAALAVHEVLRGVRQVARWARALLRH